MTLNYHFHNFNDRTTMKQLIKIDKWMVMVTIVCVAFLTGCGKTAKDGESASGESNVGKATTEESVEAQGETESADEDAAAQEGFAVMANNWKKTPITVSPKGAKANIQDFAQAFCGQYSSYEPNKKMLKYLANPKAYNVENEVYSVLSDIPNGYISSSLFTEIDRFTKMCYWNRKNGHSLVGVFMINGSENENSESAFMFYDYDPKTNVMTPDTDVCQVVEKVALNKDFEDYALELPQKGKDIVVKLYSDNGEEGYDITEMTLKWTGDTFTLVAQ